MRVRHLWRCPPQLKGQLPSNGLLFGDLSDYSTLLESLQRLRYAILIRRNDRVPVNRLPVEVLMLICKLTLPPPDPQFTKPDDERLLCTTKLTHVCRRWRSVLISSPALWTTFRVVKTAPKFVAECLQRSKPLPVHVSFKWDSSDPDYDSPSTSVAGDDGSVGDDGSDVVDKDGNAVDGDDTDRTSSSESDDSDDGTHSRSTLSIYSDHRDVGYSWTTHLKEAQGYHHLMQHTHRIATLDISFPAPGDDEDEDEDEDEYEDNSFACGLLSYPFPVLKTLNLRFLGGDGVIPKVILDKHIPTVERLLLENILPTQIADFSLDITSLDLKATGSDTLFDQGLLLRFLGNNRQLRSLTLHNYKFRPLPEPVTPVALDDLRQLDLLSDSTTFLRHLAALPLGPQSFLRIGRSGRRLLVQAENGAAGTSTSVSTLIQNFHPGTDMHLSTLSGIFGSGWEEATHVVAVTPPGGWGQGFVDQFLSRLTKLEDLLVECRHNGVGSWLYSLTTSKERCPKLRRIRLDIAPECCPDALGAIRKLVERRAEEEIPLEVVEQADLSPSAVGTWNDLYNRWRIEDYLLKRDL